MKKIRSTCAYLWAMLVAGMRGYKTQRKKLFAMSFFMMLQNTMFFVLWIVLFGVVDDLKGWQLTDVARMYGIASSAIGLSLFFFGGVRTIAMRVQDGSMDDFITRPRHPLPAVLMSSSSFASLGDVFYGPLMWFTFGGVTLAELPLMLLLTLAAAAVFTSMCIVIFSLAFWLKGSTRFPEQLFLMLIIFTTVQQHGQPFLVQLIMYSIMPAAFISYLPTELMRSFDWQTLGIIIAATAFYVLLAIAVFNAGLRRYVRAVSY